MRETGSRPRPIRLHWPHEGVASLYWSDTRGISSLWATNTRRLGEQTGLIDAHAAIEWGTAKLLELGLYPPPTEHQPEPEPELGVTDGVLMAAARAAGTLHLQGLPGSQTEVQDAFRRLSKRLHPDAGGDADDLRALVEARDLLLALLGGSD